MADSTGITELLILGGIILIPLAVLSVVTFTFFKLLKRKAAE